MELSEPWYKINVVNILKEINPGNENMSIDHETVGELPNEWKNK